MSSNDSLGSVVDKVELLLAERRQLSAIGPQFRIVHRLRVPGTECMPGEEVFAVALVYRGREFYLPLSRVLLLLFDYLARHRRIAQSSAQIEAGMSADTFYAEHGSNAVALGTRLTRRISRQCVKEYVKRLRRVLAATFDKAGLRIDPEEVLLSQPTGLNQVGYRLRAQIEWVHIDAL